MVFGPFENLTNLVLDPLLVGDQASRKGEGADFGLCLDPI
jgi:hypothetical protein